MELADRFDLSQVFSLTDFLRNHRRHVLQLSKSGRPSVITINGKPALVIQDASSYQSLLDRLIAAEAPKKAAMVQTVSQGDEPNV